MQDLRRARRLAFGGIRHSITTAKFRALLGEGGPPPEERFPFAIRRLWKGGARALDVGAAVGRVTFDLARDHAAVWGLDRAGALIRGARAVQHKGCARYRTQLEGDIDEQHEVAVETAGNVRFMVGDALALPFPERCFDTVVVLNLIDRVPDPALALDELDRVTRGTLIISSPFTWLAEYTAPERWLGGFSRNDEPVRGIESVRARFARGFTLESEQRLPFFMPHHERSAQISVTLVLAFLRS